MSDQQKTGGVATPDVDQERDWVDPSGGLTHDEIKHYAKIYDEPFMEARELADHLGLYLNTVRRKIDMVDGKPSPTSEFPNAYKPAGVTSPVRIPMSDIEAYKARKVAGVEIGETADA